MKKLILFFLFLSFNSGFAQTGWVFQNPLHTGDNLTDIAYFNSGTIYASGYFGGFQKSTDGGTTWTYKNLIVQSLTNSKITGSLSAPDPQNIFILSSYFREPMPSVFTLLKSTDAGNHWNTYHIDSTGSNFGDIKFINSNTGFCYGRYNQFIFKTSNGGLQWSKYSINSNDTLNSVFFLNENTGWITGSRKLYKTTNAGLNWSTVTSSLPNIYSLPFFLNESTGWISSGYELYKTINGGINYINQGQGPYSFNGVHFFNENTGLGFMNDASIYITTNSGINWTFSNPYLYNGSFINSSTGMLAGMDGKILKTTNAAATWSDLSSNILSNTDLADVCFADENYGWAIGGKKLIRTSNGGNLWVADSDTSRMYNEIKFLNQNKGVAGTTAGIYLSTNSGNNWILTSPPEFSLYSFFNINICTPDIWYIIGKSTSSSVLLKTTNGGFNWTLPAQPSNPLLLEASFVNENTGYMTTYSQLFKTTNGSASWNNISFSEWGNHIQFTDNNTGWILKGDVLYKTTNAGVYWESRFGLSQISIYSMNFLNNSTGWIIANGSGPRIIKTTDGGQTFFNNGYASYPGLKKINFINANTAWAVGSNATIIKTTTGGTTFIQSVGTTIPDKFYLEQNYPNPFNPSTNIEFSIPQKSFVKLKVFDLLGREAANLVNENLSAGKYKYDFNASALPSGIYFYKLETDNFSESKKMILVK